MNQITTKQTFQIKEGISELGLFATETIPANTIIFELTGENITKPTHTSVQVGADLHIENRFAKLLNHHCQANAYIDQKRKCVVSARQIYKDEEITFNYNENENLLESPFICRCCGKCIQGKNTII